MASLELLFALGETAVTILDLGLQGHHRPIAIDELGRPFVELLLLFFESAGETRKIHPQITGFTFKLGSGRQQTLARQDFDVLLDPLSLDLALRHNSLCFSLCVGDEAGRRAARTLP